MIHTISTNQLIADDSNVAVSFPETCDAWVAAARASNSYLQISQTWGSTDAFYDNVRKTLLSDVLMDGYDIFPNAYQIFEYLNYQYIHNGSIKGTTMRTHHGG